MWVEENHQFVRAPTPQSFDRLVQNLEDNDNVLFESISLPSSKNKLKESTLEPEPQKSLEKIPSSRVSKLPVRSGRKSRKGNASSTRTSSTQATDTSNSNTILDEDDDMNEVQQIRMLISQAEMENKRRDQMIDHKNAQIEELQRRIRQMQGTPARATTSQARRQPPDSDLMQFYKDKYENTIKKYHKLMEVLQLSGTQIPQTARSIPASKWTSLHD